MTGITSTPVNIGGFFFFLFAEFMLTQLHGSNEKKKKVHIEWCMKAQTEQDKNHWNIFSNLGTVFIPNSSENGVQKEWK